MPEILVLDQNTIDKIAAGEVVEKPYSVVKELVENAIDAKASAITIEIKDGGCSFIRITDNGCGIAKEQIELAFLRHSTSKIRKVEDLMSISSLGFRGEALSSISAVSQVELITKTADSFVGSKYEIHGGKRKSFEEIGAPDGTTFIVRNLFYNTPARKKFLKTATTEGNYIQNLVERLALSHPEVSFKFINNNQMKLHTSGNCNLKDIIYQIYGRDVAANLLEVSFESDEARITGFIGKPLISRGNRQYENYFVNGRYVKSNIVSKAIEQGYKNFLMQHKYPFTVLLAEFDGKYIDVNVHPTKMELRFSEEEKVFQLFYHVIYDALTKRELISADSLEDKKKPDVSEQADNLLKSGNGRMRSAEPFEKKRFAKEQLQREEQTKEAVSYISKKEEHKPLLREKSSYNISYKNENNEEIKNFISEAKKPENIDYNAEAKKSENIDYNAEAKKSEDIDYTAEDKKTQSIEKAGVKPDIKPDMESDTKLQDLPEKSREPIQTQSQSGNPQSAEFLQPQSGNPQSSEFSQQQSGNPQSSEFSQPQSGQSQPKPVQMSMFEENLVEKSIRDEIKIIGQVFDTYWILEYDNQMYIIDQHAAHEKVLYERMMKLLEKKEFTSQMINPPMVITVSALEKEILEKYSKQFEQIGFEIEPFGGKEYAVKAIPANLYGLNERDIFLEMLDDLASDSGKTNPDTILDKIASMSCKAAIKGNMKISFAEAKELLLELMELENPYNCPHGRPVIVSISKKDMEKKFKRIL